MRNKKLKEEFIDHFNNKYTTSVTFDEIMAEINSNEENVRLQEYREYYRRNTEKLLKKTKYFFSGIIGLLLLVFVVSIFSLNYVNDYGYGIEDILTKEELNVVSSGDGAINISYNHIILEDYYDLYIIRSKTLVKNIIVYKYYYKIIFNKEFNRLLTLKIDNQEYTLTPENSFSEFYTLEKGKNEEVGITFSTIYDDKVKTYSYIE